MPFWGEGCPQMSTHYLEWRRTLLDKSTFICEHCWQLKMTVCIFWLITAY